MQVFIIVFSQVLYLLSPWLRAVFRKPGSYSSLHKSVGKLQKLKAFMPPPPAATCIAFYPQDNNIIAIGIDDSSILIYHVRTDEVSYLFPLCYVP